MTAMSADVPDDDDDALLTAAPADAPPAYARQRDPVELIARIKAEGMRGSTITCTCTSRTTAGPNFRRRSTADT